MTPQAQAELHELELTPEQLAEKTRRMDELLTANRPALAQQLADTPMQPAPEAPAAPKTKATRSDKGKLRPKPVTAVALAGTLTAQQWARMGVLVEEVTQAAVNLMHARGRSDKANAEYRDYLDSLKGA